MVLVQQTFQIARTGLRVALLASERALGERLCPGPRPDTVVGAQAPPQSESLVSSAAV